jgi:hypothetical protein
MAKSFGSKQSESEIISNIMNYHKFLKKWDDPSVSRFQHIQKIENVPYMELIEDEKKEQKEEKEVAIDAQRANQSVAEKDI